MGIRRIAASIVAVAAASTLGGCAWYGAPVVPPQGWVFTSISAPLDVDQDVSQVSPRHGRASSIAVLGLVAVGDASMQAAAEDGDLSIIHGADYEYLSVLGIYQNFTVVAHGE